ncbi:fatty-acyl-CoA racemase [Bordetella pertussis]|nr:fatty-acyl-CoA racemase [Bordetella pertussis]
MGAHLVEVLHEWGLAPERVAGALDSGKDLQLHLPAGGAHACGQRMRVVQRDVVRAGVHDDGRQA